LKNLENPSQLSYIASVFILFRRYKIRKTPIYAKFVHIRGLFISYSADNQNINPLKGSQISLRKDNTNRAFEPIGKRWVVERTFSRFDNDRRLYRNYELLMETAEEIVKVSDIKQLLNKI
jgi:hypothetical protein